HFEACRNHLNPGGIMATWVPLFALNVPDFTTILRTFVDVFPHATLWYAGNCLNRHALLVAKAGDSPLTIDWSALVTRMGRPDVAADLGGLNLGDPVAFLDCFVTGEEGLKTLSATGEVNRDEHPVLEFGAPRILARDTEVVANLVDLVARSRATVF